jgi:hypothetical protein
LKRRDLGVSGADRPTESLAVLKDVGVVSSWCLIERRNAVLEILRQQPFDKIARSVFR